MNAKQEYLRWLSSPNLDDSARGQLLAIQNNENEIRDRFYRNLEFGTGGLRGLLGTGSNRINRYTVRCATLGLALYLKNVPDARRQGVAIAFDSRHGSKEFARETALTLAQEGICAHLFESLCPTPELSFAVRHLGAAAGVVITASHNPKEYNGYKVYGADGGQITPETARAILTHMQSIDPLSVQTMEEKEAVQSGLLKIIGKDVDDAYLAHVLSLRPDAQVLLRSPRQPQIVYTPLHGSGNLPVRKALRDYGYAQVTVVGEQEWPDGDFPTVASPNPENAQAFAMAIRKAKQIGADLILGTDPDCDRLGVMVPEGDEYVPLNGNQLGCLMLDYILRTSKVTPDSYIVKTIVTTPMANAIAKANNVRCFDVLTGFKFIGEVIEQMESQGNHGFLLGFEESYGYLTGGYVRDKDAVIASTLAADVATDYLARGMTLLKGLESLYQRYGYFLEELKSITLPGESGMEKISAAMTSLRENPPEAIGGFAVEAMEDYQMGARITPEGSQPLQLPQSNVLRYQLAEESWLCIRPSGTEPKIKIYYGVHQNSMHAARQAISKIETWASDICR